MSFHRQHRAVSLHRRGRSLLHVAGLCVLSACSPSSCIPTFSLPDAGLPGIYGTEDPIQEELVVQGRVSFQAADQPAAARSGVTVRLSVDANGDGAVGTGEFVEATTDSDGVYRLQKPVTRGNVAVVRYSDDGAVTLYRSIQAGPKANVRLNVTMVASQPLDCQGGRCGVEDQRLTVTGLGSGVGGRARVFNPVTEQSHFPGNFDDAAGNLLISGVFSVVELTDGNGNPVETLGQPAQLRMALPRDTWRVVKDLRTGTGRIEVPMYAFDDAAGTWRAEGEGVLEDAAGNVLPESALAAIRGATWEGAVVAQATVTHFSSWNVDWPVTTKGCIRGVVLDREGQPAEGATVFAAGVTYNGSSTGVTAGPDGSFCVDVMRSDGAGEDIDQDGITGETQRVKLRVSHRGLIYDLGEVSTPVNQGTCEDGTCQDAGTLRIGRDNEVVAVACTITGTVRDAEGQPVAGATLFAFDPGLDPQVTISLCVGAGNACDFSTTSATDGTYTLRTAVLDAVTVVASLSSTPAAGITRTGTGLVNVNGCPTGPQDITLEIFDVATPTVSVTGSTIAWTPNVPGTSVVVTRGSTLLWQVSAVSAAGFPSPVTYGTAPAGGQVVGTDGGPPPALMSGDTVSVTVGGVGQDGQTYAGGGSTNVP